MILNITSLDFAWNQFPVKLLRIPNILPTILVFPPKKSSSMENVSQVPKVMSTYACKIKTRNSVLTKSDLVLKVS